MSGEKHFTQVVTQEKSRDEDYRSFLTCRASDGTRWELRGYGKTVVEATADAWANFKCSEDEWDLHGYPLKVQQEKCLTTRVRRKHPQRN